jgi:hypothetical protein
VSTPTTLLTYSPTYFSKKKFVFPPWSEGVGCHPSGEWVCHTINMELLLEGNHEMLGKKLNVLTSETFVHDAEEDKLVLFYADSITDEEETCLLVC